MLNNNIISVNHLSKRFKHKKVVNDLSFKIKAGEVFALLGPNGAGKTTTLKMMTTLLKPTTGSITIMDHDTQKESKAVRKLFGLTSQTSTVDENLSARENLMIFARLNGLNRKEAQHRTNQLLTEFSFTNSAEEKLANFSGGMRRRLDLAISLITRPKILFLDEPTTGLDPRTRMQLWNTIRKLVKAGSTIILTTQYLEEADQLADHVALIDQGKIVGFGTQNELKDKVGGTKLTLHFTSPKQTQNAIKIIENNSNKKVQKEHQSITINLQNIAEVSTILNQLTSSQIIIDDLKITKPSMDDVFFNLTVGKN